ncbi:MAG: hypothetical protein OEY45_01995 [Gammaproteobacteria bacterium]|nr:hypothetical protein [Gammaproteobacteria bacterium]
MAELTATGRPVCIQNYGQNGFVSTQDLIELIRQLQQGNVPSLPVFYSGYNDAFAAFQTGQPDVYYDLDKIAAKLDKKPDGALLKRIFSEIAKRSSVLRF